MTKQTNNSLKRFHTHEEDYDDEGGSKRRKSGDESSAAYAPQAKFTVYRYLCPGRKVGSLIGKCGENVRHLIAASGAMITIGESIPGCKERVVTISSTSDESNASEATGDYVCPAQDALFRVHERLVGSEASGDEDFDIGETQVSVGLLVPADQVGHIIGKGGQVIHSIRNDSKAQVDIFKDEHLPFCATSGDELIQITGHAPTVKKALFQISSLLFNHSPCMQNLQDETVYRYLCSERSIGSIIGKGGETVKQLRSESQAKITIGDRVLGCKERVVTICSSSEKTSIFGDMDDYVCPAQDALFRLHERLVSQDPSGDEDTDTGVSHTSVRLLVPSDHIGHIIGKGGHVIQDIRNNSEANIQILKGRDLPACANSGDELLQISGQALKVMKALVQVSSCLRDRSPHLQLHLSPSDSHAYLQHRRNYPERDKSSSKVFVLSLVCPSANVARVIGKSGSMINKIRQQSGAFIKVDSTTIQQDCIISISEKESFEDLVSSAVHAAIRLQPICSETTERGHLYITQLLVPASQIGCLIGKGGSVITEMRRATQANIRIMPKEDLPKVASEDDVLVQISGELPAARNALVQISTRLKANIFGRDRASLANIEFNGSQLINIGRRTPVLLCTRGGMSYNNHRGNSL